MKRIKYKGTVYVRADAHRLSNSNADAYVMYATSKLDGVIHTLNTILHDIEPIAKEYKSSYIGHSVGGIVYDIKRVIQTLEYTIKRAHNVVDDLHDREHQGK